MLIYLCLHASAGSFCARRQKEVKVELNHGHSKKKLDNRGLPAKTATSKSSVLQSIYGEFSSTSTHCPRFIHTLGT